MAKKKAAASASSTNLAIMAAAAVIIVIVAVYVVYNYTSKPQTPGNSNYPESCVPQQSFVCTSLVYYAGNGNITTIVGQDTGTNWVSTTLIFVPEGTNYSNSVPVVSWSSGNTVSGMISDGNLTRVTLPATGATKTGATIYGTIWAQYQTNAGGTIYYAELANVTALAV